MTRSSASASRWYTDRGAIPGEPLCFLDVPAGLAPDYASATITVVDLGGPDNGAYLATVHTPRRPFGSKPLTRGPFDTLEAAQEWAEAHAVIPTTPIPVTILPEIAVLNTYRPQAGEILISIQEPGRPPIVPYGRFLAIHHFGAWDIPYRILDEEKDLKPLSLDDAHELIEFVLRYRNQMTALTIHCHAGVSRSPAVALALAEWVDTTPHAYALIERYPCFNRQIYRTLCQAAQDKGLIPS